LCNLDFQLLYKTYHAAQFFAADLIGWGGAIE